MCAFVLEGAVTSERELTQLEPPAHLGDAIRGFEAGAGVEYLVANFARERCRPLGARLASRQVRYGIKKRSPAYRAGSVKLVGITRVYPDSTS
jgi:hypothetical protein